MRDGGPTYGRPQPEQRLFQIAGRMAAGTVGGLVRSAAPVQRQAPNVRVHSSPSAGDRLWAEWTGTMADVVTDTITLVELADAGYTVGTSLAVAGDTLSILTNQAGLYTASCAVAFASGVATGGFWAALTIDYDNDAPFVRATGDLAADVGAGTYPAEVAMSLTWFSPATSKVTIEVLQDSGGDVPLANASLYVVRLA